MAGVGGSAAQAEEDEGLEGADILLGVPDLKHVVVDVNGAGAGSVHAVDQGLNGVGVKVDVGDGGEETLDEELVELVGAGNLPVLNGAGQRHERAGELILQVGDLGGLAAGAGLHGAAGAADGLFALKTKHLGHGTTSSSKWGRTR